MTKGIGRRTRSLSTLLISRLHAGPARFGLSASLTPLLRPGNDRGGCPKSSSCHRPHLLLHQWGYEVVGDVVAFAYCVLGYSPVPRFSTFVGGALSSVRYVLKLLFFISIIITKFLTKSDLQSESFGRFRHRSLLKTLQGVSHTQISALLPPPLKST